jgi:hypothetical protein
MQCAKVKVGGLDRAEERDKSSDRYSASIGDGVLHSVVRTDLFAATKLLRGRFRRAMNPMLIPNVHSFQLLRESAKRRGFVGEPRSN